MAMDDGAAIELSEDLHRKWQLSPSPFHSDGFRHRAYEIAAKPDKGTHLSLDNAHARLNGVASFGAKRLEVILLGKSIERGKFKFLGNFNSYFTLNIVM